ncbi:MAG: hypothetical protein K2G32_06340 [Oscillospiraceae bacterium]|nr:hypothetical protein [Oscillospiraceae bacterium]
MSESNFFYYRGYPLIRSGDTIFYGSGGDEYAARLTIKDTRKINDLDVPNKIMVQLIPKNPANLANARKGEFIGLYEALDTAHIWITEAIF